MIVSFQRAHGVSELAGTHDFHANLHAAAVNEDPLKLLPPGQSPCAD